MSIWPQKVMSYKLRVEMFKDSVTWMSNLVIWLGADLECVLHVHTSCDLQPDTDRVRVPCLSCNCVIL